MWYKMLYHLKRKNGESRHSILFNWTKYIPIVYFLPVNKKYNSNTLEQQSRKRANIALLIFSLSIIIELIFSLFAK